MMKWKLMQVVLSGLLLAWVSTPAQAEFYNNNGFNPYNSLAGLYNTGGQNLYNFGTFGNQLYNYYGNNGLGGFSNYSYPNSYGSCGGFGSIYSSGCSAFNNLGFGGYYDPYSYSYGNSFGNYYDPYSYSSGGWGDYWNWDSNWGGNSWDIGLGWNYSSYYPGWDYGGYYGGGSNYYGGSSYWNYSPVNINVYNINQQPQQIGLGGCNGVTIPCPTTPTNPVNPVNPVNPINPIFTPQTQVTPTDPIRFRIPRGGIRRSVTH